MQVHASVRLALELTAVQPRPWPIVEATSDRRELVLTKLDQMNRSLAPGTSCALRREALRVPVAQEERARIALQGDCVILLDIDHFSLVNDTDGQAPGDAVLVAVARRPQEVVREFDVVLRWGGRELLVTTKVAAKTSAIALPKRREGIGIQ